MASILLSEVPASHPLAATIARNWAEYRAFRNDEPPAELRVTSHMPSGADGNNSPSHVRGRAIDLVTPDWSQRGYLLEFGLWLALRYQAENWNVIFYRRDFQPHLHVADWSGRVSKPEASIGFNQGAANKYRYFLPPYNKDVQGLFTDISATLGTYTENAAQSDWDLWARVIRGEESPPWAVGSGTLGKIWPWLKANWWLLILPVVVGVPLWLFMRNRSED